MARPVYSELLAAFTILGTSGEVIDLPSPNTWIVRDIDMFFIAGSVAGDGLIVELSGVEVIRFSYPDYYFGQFTWRGRIVAPGGSTLSFSGGSSTSFGTGQVSGYSLTPA